MEVALFRLVGHVGLQPDYLVGHSIGELAAAHVAGVFGLEDAARLVSARGALMGALPAGGAMVAIEASEEEVAAALQGRETVAIAAVNGPRAMVISGGEEPVLEVQALFEGRDRRTRRLAVSHAFHSPLMEPMLEEFAAVAAELHYSEPKIPILSTLTGEPMGATEATDPEYWVRQARGTVRFAAALEAADVAFCLELGPDSVLAAIAADSLDTTSAAPLLRAERPELETLSEGLAAAHVCGAAVEWARIPQGARQVPLPTYPFQRERLWLGPEAGAADLSAAGLERVDHPLLGAAMELPGEGLVLSGRLSPIDQPWLPDHVILGEVVVPGAALLEIAAQAAEQVGADLIDELTLQSPLVLSPDGAAAVRVRISPEEEGRTTFTISSRSDEGEAHEPPWAVHATGSLSTGQGLDAEGAPPAWPPVGFEEVALETFYDEVATVGFAYGPSFQNLRSAWRRGNEIVAEVELDKTATVEGERFLVHPALLDSCLQTTLLSDDLTERLS
ncbi:MAG TPA: acyltransferase domain-containing protein, partial [Solirubrobacterales bacterium]